MRHAIAAVAILLSLTTIPAAGSELKWIDSPEAYFATQSEREEWKKVATESDASQFIADFRARRGPGFEADVKERVANADKYLTIGKVPGSQTLRGRVVVLFGPPSGMTTADRTKSTSKRDNPAVAGAISNVGTSGGSGRNAEDVNMGSTMSTVNAFRTFTISYAGKAAEQVGRKDVVFVIETDLVSGRDRFVGRGAEKQAEELFELAAQASLRKQTPVDSVP